MNKEKIILGEIERRTKKNERHYRKNDGTTECVISNANINYFDEKEQKWKHTDNSLVEKESCYEGNLGNFQAKISKDNKGIDVSGNDMSVAWEYLGMEKPKKKGRKPKNTKKPNMKVETRKADNEDIIVGSDALYEEADDGVDIQYIMQGNNVKENIIVKEKQKKYKFKFAFKLNGLKMKVSEDHTKIELYSEKTDKLEFTIPSPYMYDANNATSTDVCYEIEETENDGCVFYVIASEAWINDAERQFPVTIDPQLVTSSNEIIKYNIKQTIKSTSGTNTSVTNLVVGDYLRICKSYYKTLESEIIINRDLMDICPENITFATLNLKAPKNFKHNQLSVCVYVDGVYKFSQDIGWVGDSISLPISSYLKNAKDEIKVVIKYSKTYSSANEFQFYATGENAPKIVISYINNINRLPSRKTISLVGGVEAHVDMFTGETVKSFTDVVDDVMGIKISHVLKSGNDDFCCGDSVRLNLHEKLVRHETDSPIVNYVYTDEMGENHLFNEHFYYLDKEGVKHSVEKPYVGIEPDGIMYFMSDEGVRKVYRDVYTHNGLKANTTLVHMNGLNAIEQRVDEVKQLEEQIKSYKNTFDDFVIVRKSDGEIYDTINKENIRNEFSYFVGRDPSTYSLMSKAEALNYKSLLLQRSELNSNLNSIGNSEDSLAFERDQIAYSTGNCNIDIEDYNIKIGKLEKANGSTDACGNKIDTTDDVADLTKTITRLEEQLVANEEKDNLVSSQETQLATQKTQVRNMIALVEEQIADIVSKHEYYKQLLKDYYLEFCTSTEELKKLKLQVPVNYLSDGKATKGFNESGDLVVIYKENGGYIVVEHEYYDLGVYTRISRVYDENEREIKFFYDDRQLLTEIVDAVGNKVTFEYDILKTVYDVGILKKVTFADGHSVDFKRIDYVETVTSDDKYAKITHNSDYKTQSIALFTNTKSVGHNMVESFEMPEKLSELTFDYDLFTTTMTDEYGDQCIYKFDADTENLVEYYEIKENMVSKAEKYEYAAFGHMNVESASEDALEKTAYASFNFPEETVDVETIETAEDAINNHKLKLLDEYNKVVKEIDIQVDEPKKLVTTNYTYDESDRVVKVEAETVDKADTTLVVQTMEYDSAGRLVRKQSYEVGKETENGIDIEEHVYNEKGYGTKSIKYNTLDTSSKLYTEKETNDIGQVTGELDVLGKHKSTYEYLAGTNTVCSKLSPNGSKLSYGFSPENGQDSITMSTEDGEENSTQKLYTKGLLTQVISGDNVYEYTYDHKGRETSVFINGQLHISYSYEDRITENGKTVNKTTATYINGDNVTVTEDIDGNVLSVNKKPYDYDTLAVENRTKLFDPNASQIELNITNEYDDKHRVIKKMDSSVNDCVFSEYEYDEQDRVTSYKREATFGASLPYDEEYSYNAHGNVTKRIVRFNNGRTDTTTYEYNENTQKLTAINCAGSTRVEPKLDCLGRNRGKTVSWLGTKIYSEDITYLKHGDHATSMPLTINYGNNTENGFVVKDRIKYKYDEMGNICEAYENGQFVTEYKYDALGRLVRENNKKLGKTFVFSYDNKGNILTRTEYAFTLKDDDFVKEATGEVFEYVYSGEKLVSYNCEIFAYDDIGNPTTYRENTLTWRFGRRLTSFGANTFDYNAEGKRIKKNDISYIYDSQGRLFAQSNGIEYFYDENSSPISFAYLGEVYYYKKDLLGNVIEILDTTGTTVVKYVYDAWGNHKVLNPDGTENTSTLSIGNINPIRYRSYYFDTETGLYFLQTRYYDPQTGRFINIDDISYLEPEAINGLNLYAYCGNNPIMYSDPNGTLKWYHWLGIIGAVIVVAAATVLTCGAAGIAIGGAGLAGAVIHGAAVGALIGAGIGIAGGAITGGIYSAVTGADFWSSVGAGAMAGFGIGAIIGAIVGGTIGYTSFAQPGVAFNPKYHSNLPQNGVNPQTVQYGRQRFETKKVIRNLFETIRKGKIEKAITVSREGIVLQGNHRLLIARLFKITIDVIIGGMSQ